MKDAKNTEITRWRWYALVVTVLGIIMYSLPWISSTYKIALTVPLYAMFVYVYYKYISLKKAAQAGAVAKEDSPDRQKITSGRNTAGKPAQKGKPAAKKGR
ncbi:hypothetical protein ACOBQJ_07345 [Pelotomaculum propionicicum]|uniref:hypothetical protein n=1 Tax=Pelotomaculum propionicicum TaxID=258475 RepID=UPI003B7EE6D0